MKILETPKEPISSLKPELTHRYRYFRAHQLATYGNSGLHIKGVDQRQYTGGGAAYQYHARAAYQLASSHMHFLKGISK